MTLPPPIQPAKKPSEPKQILVGGLAFIGLLVVLFFGAALVSVIRDPERPSTITAAHAAAPTAQTAPAQPPPTPAVDPETAAIAADIVRLTDPTTMGRAILDWRAMAPDLPYAALERGADSFRGQRVVFRGRVAEIHDIPNGGSSMRIATRGRYDNIYWVESYTRPEPTVIQGASVVVVGKHAGSFTYQSQAGWNITLPAVLGYAVLPASTASAAERAAQRAAR